MSHIATQPAIDVHAHYGVYSRPDKGDLSNDFMTADTAEVARRAQQCGIVWTIVSPLSSLFPRGDADAFVANEHAACVVPQTPGLLQIAVVNPLDERTFRQARHLLAQPHCVGIKIHPEAHSYSIAEYGQTIFELAQELDAVVITHSGEQNSLPADFVGFANCFPEVQLVLGHIGCGWDQDLTHQVRAIQQCRHGNVYADTSSAKSIIPKLIEWAVREVSAERVLFGSDSPLYFSPMQRARIDHADLSEAQKKRILFDYAWALFNLDRVAKSIAADCEG
jgi:predicted TIM-barrel fold metal-dependent hydrolase